MDSRNSFNANYSSRHPNKSQKGKVDKLKITLHLLLAIAVFFLFGYLVMISLGIFTHHGEYKNVPEVKGRHINEATQILEENGFKWEISDSLYNDKYRPGTVIEQSPESEMPVKASRVIYLTINALYPRQVIFPDFGSNTSERIALAKLKELGFQNVTVEKELSEHLGLYLHARANGKEIYAGDTLPVSANIVIVVGDGEYNAEAAQIDSIANAASTTDDYNSDNSGASHVEFLQ